MSKVVFHRVSFRNVLTTRQTPERAIIAKKEKSHTESPVNANLNYTEKKNWQGLVNRLDRLTRTPWPLLGLRQVRAELILSETTKQRAGEPI